MVVPNNSKYREFCIRFSFYILTYYYVKSTSAEVVGTVDILSQIILSWEGLSRALYYA